MFRKLAKNKKAQNTAEYAILIALVVAFIIAMQTYAQRALQARVRDASLYLKNQTTELGVTVQYEPYYLESDFNVIAGDNTVEVLGLNEVSMVFNSDTTRKKGGTQSETGAENEAGGVIDGL